MTSDLPPKDSLLNKPFQIGSVTLPSNIFYAPLAGNSDYPFRQMSAKYKPGLMYCEMVKMDPLLRNDSTTFEMLDYSEEMRPIGGQLCGSKPEMAGPCAKIIQELGFDVIDLNCGCPVDKVTKDGSGSGLLKSPEKIGEIISNMVAAVSIPVTLKIRIGWDAENINAVKITEIAEAAGASAICVHGRTREQAYRGPADWGQIKACKEAAKKIKVIGNGDLFDANAAIRMLNETGCDAVLIARGTMGQPWIADQVYQLKQGLIPTPPTSQDLSKALMDHFHHMLRYLPERRTLLEMRRVGCWYIKGTFGASEFRGLLNKAENISELQLLLEKVCQQMQ